MSPIEDPKLGEDPFATGPPYWVLANAGQRVRTGEAWVAESPRRLARPFTYRRRQRTVGVPSRMVRNGGELIRCGTERAATISRANEVERPEIE